MGIFTIFAILYSAYSAYSQAQAQQNAAEYNAAVARNNQILADAEKQAEAQRGVDAELDLRRKTRVLKGKQRAGMAAAGLDLSEGSALDILTGTDVMGEVDALRIRHDSAMNQWRISEKAKAYGAQSDMYKSQAKSINPLLSGVGAGFMTGVTSGAFGGASSASAGANGLKYTSSVQGFSIYGK